MEFNPLGFKVTAFRISRRLWFRGRGGVTSKLRKEDGSGCCVGHYLLFHGIPETNLLDKSTISTVGDMHPEITSLALSPVTCHIMDRIYAVNDFMSMADSQREELLKCEFSSLGVKLTFIE